MIMLSGQQTLTRPTSNINLQQQQESSSSSNAGMKRSLSAPNGVPLIAMDEASPVKKQRLMQAMAASGAAKKLMIRPSDYAKAVFKSNGFSVAEVQVQYEAKIQTPSEDMVQAYSSPVLNLVRRGDLKGLEKAQQEGKTLQCCNRFGESLLHLACRRSYTEIANFLITSTGKTEESRESNSSNMLHIRDDFKRTPLHDACWTAEPNLELVDLLIRSAPEQVVMEDVRGNTPFDYVRKDHYGMWLKFLWERKDLLKPVEEPQQQAEK